MSKRSDRAAGQTTHNQLAGGPFHGTAVQIGTGTVNIGDRSRTPDYLTNPGYWPRASTWDAMAAGVHPARRLSQDVDIPPYIERDIDEELRTTMSSAREHGGLVLLLGHSAAGKTRAAFEAMRVVLPEHRVAQPTRGTDLPIILETVARCDEQCVLWLDNLEQFLGDGALDQNMLAAFARHRVPVIATIRVRSYEIFNPAIHDDLEILSDPVRRQIARVGARVLETAKPIELQRIWSEEEVERARCSSDERIADAVACHGAYGVAEYLAAGPAVWAEWQRAFDVDGHPRGAAVVAAAVDLARTGLTGPYAEELIVDLHEQYLEARGGALLRPEPLKQAFAWASQRRLGVTSPLLPASGGGWTVFDYLVDRVERFSPTRPIPDDVWTKAAENARADERMNLAVRAAEAGSPRSFEVAEGIWRKELRDNSGEDAALAAYNLGILFTETDRPQDAEAMFRLAAQQKFPSAAFNLSVLLSKSGSREEALQWSRFAAEAGYVPALFQMGFLLEDQGLVDEAAVWYQRAAESGEYRAATNLGKILSEAGRAEEAQSWFHRADEEGDQIATFNIGLFHHDAGRFDLAEQWYRRAIERGSAEAALNLGIIKKKSGDRSEAENLYRSAADSGIPGGAYNLGLLFEEAGDIEEAVSWLENAVNMGHSQAHRALVRVHLENGRPEDALPWLERAASQGDSGAAGALGEILHDLGRDDEAIPHLMTAAEAGQLDAAFNLGVVLVHRGDFAEASGWYKRAAEGGDAEAAVNLADLHFREGRVASALWWTRRARVLQAGR
ncbi:tetratricopeptide repeat protein [Amycolatopsis sacchari]|uniref:SEL1-like repeat protein n=1 Tax=Amycolatopsis sacchari TaxID=115433 RepID=UPI003D74999F